MHSMILWYLRPNVLNNLKHDTSGGRATKLSGEQKYQNL